MAYKADLLALLEYINPAGLDYQDWINVGMALKEEGYSAVDWDAWSRRDPARYHPGECIRKWNSFRGAAVPVTGGTLVQMAMEGGWEPERGYELEWDGIIEDSRTGKDCPQEKELTEPVDWNPAGELIRYLEALFEPAENVGYVTESWEKDGRYMPLRGNWDRTAGQLIEQLSCCNGDIGSVMGDCNPQAGAWIRFNPLDGNGCKNENVTDFRFALVESDCMGIEEQYAVMRELELPVACLVHSGKKSLHAIVHIDAADYNEYRKRVDYLYNMCQKNGLKIDRQNKNPSRLSRMPGVIRNGKKQFLVAVNIGKASWDEWHTWAEEINDDLPEPESLESVWGNMPELSPELIEGVLRQGHKMLLAGPSKAGKSFALIELSIALAEGRRWFGWQCTRGRVLYVNLELDRASCLRRFKDVYEALGWQENNLANLDVWNLRGKSIPMDKLAPKLIRRAAKKDYIAVIIDPIYKIITGDENSADQMAQFCNQFDLVCTKLGTAVIYCHHHSKGSQGSKRSMDRASGSGVFARDPDALLDLIELEPTDALFENEENNAVCDVCIRFLNEGGFKWEDDVSQDEMCSSSQMLAYCKKKLSMADMRALESKISATKEKTRKKTAWRIEGTLREFPKFEPLNLWFDYPMHKVDKTGALKDIQPDEAKAPWQKAIEKRKTPGQKKKERAEALEAAVAGVNFGDAPLVSDLAEVMGISERSVRERIKEHGGYEVKGGIVRKKT